MHWMQVDFNNTVGPDVLLASARDREHAPGEHVGVYDDGTDVYDAEVLEQTDGTVLLRVGERVNP